MESIILKFVGKLITGLKLAASSIFGRLFAGSAMSLATFQYVYPNIKGFLQSKFLALPPKAVELMTYCAVDVLITVIVSAYVAQMGLKLALVSSTVLQNQINGAN
ncbi:hypothetical protein [Pseudoxanthomonas beigongshangi]